MKTIKSILVVLSTWIPSTYRTILGVAVFLITIILFAQAPGPGMAKLKVMKQGLGSGTIRSGSVGIDCGGDCDENFAIT